jgi:glutamate dehydrogenase (NADP+)
MLKISKQNMLQETSWEVKCDIALPCATQKIEWGWSKNFSSNGCICVAEGANMPICLMQLLCFKKQNYYSLQEKHQMQVGCNFRFRNVSKLIEIKLDFWRGWWKIKRYYVSYSSCVKYGSDTNGYVDYVKGANIAGL